MPPRRRRGRNVRVDDEAEHSHNAESNANGDRNANQNMTVDRWIGMHLEKFDGTGTPMEAASWLRTMEKYMSASAVTPEEKVIYVRFQLKGLADDWWDGVCAAWATARGPLTWDVFVQQFTTKYYPASFREKMDFALRNIKQGNKTVDEYEAEFSKIVHFVEHINQNEREKARRFFEGLNPQYRHVMGVNCPNDYFTVVEQARGLELEFQLTEAEAARTGGTSGAGSGHKRSNQDGSEPIQQSDCKKFKSGQQTQQSSKPRQSVPQSSSAPHFRGTSLIRPVPGHTLMCFKCGKNHRAFECDFKGTCRHCGREGHMSKVCKGNPNSIIKWQVPMSSSAGSSVNGPRSSGSVVRASHGSLQMMTTPQQYQSHYQSFPPQQYYPHYQPFPPQQIPPPQPGYYWPATPVPTPPVPLQLPAPSTAPAPPQPPSGGSLARPGIYTMPTSSSLGRPDVVTGTQNNGMHGRE
ncbi:hypothetical protein ACQJBY_063553 [Aegilops geniculata]